MGAEAKGFVADMAPSKTASPGLGVVPWTEAGEGSALPELHTFSPFVNVAPRV